MALPALAAAAAKAVLAKKKFGLIKKAVTYGAMLLVVGIAALSGMMQLYMQRGDAARAAMASLGAVAPAGLRAPAAAASTRTGIPAEVLLAIAYIETTYGRAAAPTSAEAAQRAVTLPADMAAVINQPALAAGGPTGSLLGLPASRAVLVGDWINPTAVGAEHAMGFMQFLPSTWRGHAAEALQALGHTADPYSPADALMAAALKLKSDIPAGQTVAQGLPAALDAYGGPGYAAKVLTVAQVTTLVAGRPDTCKTPVLTQGYGAVTLALEPALRGAAHYHTGADLSCGFGTQIVSVTDGVAHVTQSTTGWGNQVVVATGGIHVRYCHLSLIAATEGAVVHAGDVIGLEGSSGASTGSHLHFEVDQGPAAFSDYQNSVAPFILLDPAGYTVSPSAEGQTR